MESRPLTKLAGNGLLHLLSADGSMVVWLSFRRLSLLILLDVELLVQRSNHNHTQITIRYLYSAPYKIVQRR